MSWLGGWLGGTSSSSGGGGGGGGSPALGIETTVEAIRDRAIAVVEALVPRAFASDRFKAYRNERPAPTIGTAVGPANAQFKRDVEASPAGKWRWFQIVDDGEDPTAEVSNLDFDEKRVTLLVTVAYVQDHRAGVEAGLDRADLIKLDQRQIQAAIGMGGRGNFAPPNPDACWRQESVTRTVGNGVDYLEIAITYSFRCDVR